MPFLKDLGLSWEERDTLLLRPGDAAMQPERLAHLYAREYVSLGFVTQSEFDAFVKFAVVRHPYDRAVSEFKFRMGLMGRRLQGWRWLTSRDFSRFIREDYDNPLEDQARHMAPQVDYVHDANGALLVDHVIEHAELETQLLPLLAEVIGPGVKLPHRNAGRAAPGFSVDVLSKGQKDALYRRYRDDFEAFGYRK